MVWSSSTTRHVGWLRSVLILCPDGLNASNPFLPDPLAAPLDGSPSRFRIIAASPSSGSLGRISLNAASVSLKGLAVLLDEGLQLHGRAAADRLDHAAVFYVRCSSK